MIYDNPEQAEAAYQRGMISRHECLQTLAVERLAVDASNLTVTEHDHDVHRVTIWTAENGVLHASEKYTDEAGGTWYGAAASMVRGWLV